MTPPRGGRTFLIWAGALVVALVVLLVDGAQRLESIREITAHRLSALPEPEPDRGSSSGYAGGQHRTILPAIDAYHWILQTERMLAGDGWRIREVTYDDAPSGREVHWSGSLRWWAGALASAHAAFDPALSPPRALEKVAPWANTAILALVLLAATPILAARFGPVPAGLFALGTVAVFPFYEYFVVGYLDHHGLAATAALLCVLCLAAGGGGWVRSESPAKAVSGWLPGPRSASRWFVTSAGAGAIGLWVSAATMVPVLVGIGLGAALAALAARGAPSAAGWTLRPGLWRLWGFVGGGLAFAFYLLEYFPSHLGMRLEVNHPLYALAWVGGGGLLRRLFVQTRRDRADAAAVGAMPTGLRILPEALALLLAPAAILLGGEAAFRLADPFLYTLHERFIIEFQPLAPQLAAMSPRVIAGRASALPLLALPLAAALWPTHATGIVRWGWRVALLAAVGVATAFAHAVLRGLLGDRAALVWVGDAVVLAAGFGLGLERSGKALDAPVRGILVLALAPAALLLALSLAQVRWVGVAAALWLAALVVAAAALRREHGFQWTGPRRAVAGVLLALVFLAAPALFLPLPLDRSDPAQEVARDASWWLRRRVGGEGAVVFTSPNATTWVAYFGGLPGVGSLYWENQDGLAAATALYTAPSSDSLHTLLQRRGVTHLVLFPWDRGLELLRVARSETGEPAAAGVLAELVQRLRSPGLAELPAWLTPLPYPPPDSRSLGHPSALILEVGREPPRATALVRLARFYQAVGSPDGTEAALRASIKAGPTVAAWALLAQLEAARGGGAAFAEAIGGVREALRRQEALEPADRLDAAIALALARDGAGATRELDAALAAADERALRRLSPDALGILVDLSRQLGLDRRHPETLALAGSLLPLPR